MLQQTILLIEDNPDDVLLTQRAFRKNHIAHQLVIAEDGVQALDYLFGRGLYAGRDTSQQPALILLDINLPRLNGHEVLKQLRADPRTALCLVVVLTSSKEEADLLQSYELRANSYIRKPVNYLEFQECVGQLGLYWLTLNQTPIQAF
jgi:two-component system, response regulator